MKKSSGLGRGLSAGALQMFACGLLALFVPAVTLADSGPAINHKLVQVDAMGNPVPICLGVSGMNPNKLDDENQPICDVGTLGALLEDLNDGSQYILSNWHVFVESEPGGTDGMVGDSITHVGCVDTAGGDFKSAIPTYIKVPPAPRNPPPYEPPFQVGSLSDWIEPVSDARVDAAIAEVSDDMATPAILDIAPFDTTVQGPLLGSVVIKSGRTTGRTFGYISGVDVEIKVDNVQFVDQIQVSPLLPADLAEDSGDSGSLFLQVQELVNQPPTIGPVGLLFAGGFTTVDNGSEQEQTFANRIDNVINAFKNGGDGDGIPRTLRFAVPENCTNDFPFPKSATKQIQIPAPPGPIPNPKEVEAASKVKDRHSKELSRIPGVIGNSVSLSQTGSRKVVIKLFVSKITPEIKRAAPSKLEGVPLELQILTKLRFM